MKITITGLPAEKMRYPGTHVDYFDRGKHTIIDVIEQSNPLHEYILTIGALVKYMLLKARGISLDDIEAWDKQNEGTLHGDDPQSPYFYEHQFSQIIEALVCNELGLKYHEYKASINPDFFSCKPQPNWSRLKGAVNE